MIVSLVWWECYGLCIAGGRVVGGGVGACGGYSRWLGVVRGGVCV